MRAGNSTGWRNESERSRSRNMLSQAQRTAILELSAKGVSKREISHVLQLAAAFAREDFQDGAGAAVAALGGLIRIGGGSDGDVVRAVDAAQFLTQQVGGGRFSVDPVFEILRRHFHEFVGIARIAILAGEFAAAIRVDGPLKRHPRAGAVEDAAR